MEGTQFDLGSRPLKRNSKKDWDAIWRSAVAGDLDSVLGYVNGRYPLRYEFRVIELCEPLAQTMRSRLEWSELATFSGVELALESRGKLGQMPVTTLTLRIRAANSGAATVAKSLLSSMSLEEALTSVTYSDGLIDTQSEWRLKDLPYPYVPSPSGSPATSTPATGTLT